ncbi:hypothetical protein OG504_00550 [Streptomyces sp. NBC_00986]|nr:hypothetical protein OG504_00550 [Streptomyces sp. NBC_00986]
MAAALPDCESIATATPCGEAPIAMRTGRRSWSRIRLKTPACDQRLKKPNTVWKGGKSWGRALHLQPESFTYRMASQTARRGWASGLPPVEVRQAGTGSIGSISSHSASLVSEG